MIATTQEAATDGTIIGVVGVLLLIVVVGVLVKRHWLHKTDNSTVGNVTPREEILLQGNQY